MSDYKIRLSSKGLFFNDQGELLLVKGRHPGSSGVEEYWSAPGGGVEEGESLKEAVEREFLEETGYHGQAAEIVFVQDYINYWNNRALEIFFIGRVLKKDKSVTADHQSKFFPEDKFKKIVFFPEGINPFELKKGVRYSEKLNQ